MLYDSSSVEFVLDSTAFNSSCTLQAQHFKPCATFTCGTATTPSNSDPSIYLERYGYVDGAFKLGSNFKPVSDTFPSGKPLSSLSYFYVAKSTDGLNKVYFTFGCDSAPHTTYYGLKGNLFYQCAMSCDESFAPYVIQSTKTPVTDGWHMWNNKSATPGSEDYEMLFSMFEWVKSCDGKTVTLYLKVGDQDSDQVYYG